MEFMNSPRDAAQSILARMQALHGTPDTIAAVDEKEFTHLDLPTYRAFRESLERRGYKYLGDFEIVNLSNRPDSFMMRTMIRSMVSADATTSAGHYQVRPKMDRLRKNLVAGLRNLRFIDAPAAYLRAAKTRACYDFESELPSGYVLTNNAEAAGGFSVPASFDKKTFPYDTSLDEVRTAHEARLAAATRRVGETPTRMATREDVEAMQRRLKARKQAHRAASGWITRDELVKFARGNTALADAIYDELQLLAKERA